MHPTTKDFLRTLEILNDKTYTSTKLQQDRPSLGTSLDRGWCGVTRLTVLDPLHHRPCIHIANEVR